MRFRHLAITHSDGLLFGHAPRPLLTRQGLHIGGGLVCPELNLTLPAMEVAAATMPAEPPALAYATAPPEVLPRCLAVSARPNAAGLDQGGGSRYVAWQSPRISFT